MDPMPYEIVAAVITSIAAFGTQVFAMYAPSDKKTKNLADRAIDAEYENLIVQVTDGSIEALKIWEKTNNAFPPTVVRTKLYPKMKFPDAVAASFDGEFRYRLEYLRMLGLLCIVNSSEYALTALGKSFLDRYKRSGR